MLLDLLFNPRLYATLAVAFLLAFAGLKTYHFGQADIQAKWDAEKLAIAVQTSKIQTEAAAKTAQLLADKEALRKTKNAQIDKLNLDLADALERLHNRPSRPSESDLPNDSSAGSKGSCTGASLYAEDSGAFIREAARADNIRLQLAECQALYSKARAACNP